MRANVTQAHIKDNTGLAAYNTDTASNHSIPLRFWNAMISGIKGTCLEKNYESDLSMKYLKRSGRNTKSSEGSRSNSKVTPVPVVERDEDEVLDDFTIQYL